MVFLKAFMLFYKIINFLFPHVVYTPRFLDLSSMGHFPTFFGRLKRCAKTVSRFSHGTHPQFMLHIQTYIFFETTHCVRQEYTLFMVSSCVHTEILVLKLGGLFSATTIESPTDTPIELQDQYLGVYT